MATALVILLSQARELGVTVSRRHDGSLAIQTPAAADTLARALRARDAEVLRLFDWRRAGVDAAAPCVLCGGAALLRDPAEGRACHKVCADVLLSSTGPGTGMTRGTRMPARPGSAVPGGVLALDRIPEGATHGASAISRALTCGNSSAGGARSGANSRPAEGFSRPFGPISRATHEGVRV